jgi:hypothetical protein
MNMRRFHWAVATTWVVGSISGCAPRADAGECSVGRACPRGEECNLELAMCMPTDLDTSSTESPAPSTFSGKVVPMFRGRACTVPEVQAGTPFPVYLDPCFHPCLVVESFKFKHSWSCIGSSCSAYGLMWVEATSDSAGCPEDAFGQFDQSQCVYAQPVEFTINPTLGDGTPVEGSMELEVPFLNNADAAAIAAAPDDNALVEERIQQYPVASNRIALGRGIRLLRDGPVAPESCGEGGSACECTPIGF